MTSNLIKRWWLLPLMINILTLMPIFVGVAWGKSSDNTELTVLACEFAASAKVTYPTEASWLARQTLIRANLNTYASQFSDHNWSSQGNKLFVLAQALYHKIVGYDGFYAYQAVVPDSRIDYSSLMAQISQFRFFGYSEIGKKIKAAGLSGEDFQ